jgi:hypothetical protein
MSDFTNACCGQINRAANVADPAIRESVSWQKAAQIGYGARTIGSGLRCRTPLRA